MYYILEFYDLNFETGVFTRTAENATYTALSYQDKRRRSDVLNLSFDLSDPINQQIVPYRTHVLVIRHSDDGDVYRQLYHFVDLDGEQDSITGEINYILQDHLEHFSYRKVDSYLETKDAGAIVQELVEDAQNKPYSDYDQLGVQIGTIETIGEVTETLNDQNVAQAIINLSDNQTSFDFEFKPVIQDGVLDHVNLNVYKELGSVRNDLPAFNLFDNLKTVTWALKQPVVNYIKGLSQGTNITTYTL